MTLSPGIPESAVHLIANGPNRYEVGRKQLTLAFGGLYIVSTTPSTKPLLVWETEKGYPRYYVPTESLHSKIKPLLAKGGSTDSSEKEVGLSLVTGDRGKSEDSNLEVVAERLNVGSKALTWVRFVSEGPLKDFIRFEHSDIDDWFENGGIFGGLKNPYKRIDTRPVSHHIVVKVDDEVVAETNVAVLLNETGLKETYYLPATSILDWGAIEKSTLRTACPYKGEARYFSLTVKDKKHENLVWYYQYPTHESAGVEGFISFYNKENVDIFVDGTKI